MKNLLTCIALFVWSLSAQAITLKAVVPADGATGVNIEGKIVLTFDVDVLVGSGAITLDGKAVTPVFVSKYTTISFAGLDYESVHVLVIPAGAIKAKTGEAFGGVTIQFTTKKRPEPTPKLFDFVVDPKATPIFGKIGKTIASAIEAAPIASGVRYHVFIKNGVYNETLNLPSNKQNISFIGQSVDSVVIRDITNPVFTISGNFLYFENLTVQNTLNPDYNQYGIAVYAEGSKNIFKNVRLLGHQDTQRTGGDRHYYLHCDIRGTIDFIYGSGDIFYDSCSIYLEPRNLMMKTTTTWDTCCVIAAGSQDNTNKWGFVFSNCSIDGDAANDNRYSLGRPWHNEAKAVFLNTKMIIKPFDYGWTSMGNPPALYAEFGSKDGNGNPIDLSKRHARYIYNGDTVTAPFNPVLDETKAATYTLTNVIGGTDAWKPNRTAIAPAAPILVAGTGKLTWAAIPYSICYVVQRNGRVVDFVTTTEYVSTESGSYSIQAAGEFGNLSEASNSIQVGGTAINWNQRVEADFHLIRGAICVRGLEEKAHLELFNLAGVRVASFVLNADTDIPWTSKQTCIGRLTTEKSSIVHLLPNIQ